MKAPSDTLTLVVKSSQNQAAELSPLIPVQEVSPDPQNPLIPFNFLMSQLSSLGQRQTNYAHVDTQINVENLNLKIGLGEAAFLLEPPTSLARTVENYYRQTHHPLLPSFSPPILLSYRPLRIISDFVLGS